MTAIRHIHELEEAYGRLHEAAQRVSEDENSDDDWEVVSASALTHLRTVLSDEAPSKWSRRIIKET